MPGRDVVEHESKAVAPSLGARPRHADPRDARRADRPPGQPARLRHSRRRLARRAADADDGAAPRAGRSEQLLRQRRLRLRQGRRRTAYTGAGRARRQPRLTLRNQTRYNQTHREAVITAIQNVAAFNPATNLVTRGAPGQRAREQDRLEPDQPRRPVRDRHACSTPPASALEFTSEEQFAPTLAGLGTRAPVDIFNPESVRPGHRLRAGAHRRVQRRADRRRSRSTPSTPSSSASAGRCPAACAGSTTTPTSGRWMPPALTTDRPRGAPTAWSAARPACCSRSTTTATSTSRTARR